MKVYKNIESIERDLKILDLERKIALEELKLLKNDYENSFRLPNWFQSGLSILNKASTILMLKRVFKK
ncbi:hypothetical protein [Cognatitamlana onchidii]|uniref:hypothetical protein n=1 Tax=Cognatitamlana onchidii TaxID=2562860 RepID=UPI0010A65025|nr:hypothetical protein [Algibacter onchidii]